MKTTLLTFLAIALLSSCGKNLTFLPSTVVPSAEGSVKVKTDQNENYVIDLNVVNLADPGRLHPPRTNYVVWAETTENGIKNLGSLRSAKGLFSNTSKGSLETATPFRPARIFITAEDDSAPQYPGTQVVLSTESFRIN